MVIENTLDLKKSLQRLLSAKEAAGRRVTAEVLQKNANEKGKSEKPHFFCMFDFSCCMGLGPTK